MKRTRESKNKKTGKEEPNPQKISRRTNSKKKILMEKYLDKNIIIKRSELGPFKHGEVDQELTFTITKVYSQKNGNILLDFTCNETNRYSLKKVPVESVEEKLIQGKFNILKSTTINNNNMNLTLNENLNSNSNSNSNLETSLISNGQNEEMHNQEPNISDTCCNSPSISDSDNESNIFVDESGTDEDDEFVSLSCGSATFATIGFIGHRRCRDPIDDSTNSAINFHVPDQVIVEEVEPIEDPGMSYVKFLNNEMGWERVSYNDVAQNDPRIPSNSSRPSRCFQDTAKSPMKAFLQLWPEYIWKHIAEYSDMKRRKLLKSMGHHNVNDFDELNYIGPTKQNNLKWYNSTIKTSKFLIFVALLILNMLQPHAGGIKNQWKRVESHLRNTGKFGLYMPRDEFRVISKCLCFSKHGEDNKTEDRLWRLRVIINTLNTTFRKAFRLGPYVSFDEAIFASKSRYMPAKIYNPLKPNKWLEIVRDMLCFDGILLHF